MQIVRSLKLLLLKCRRFVIRAALLELLAFSFGTIDVIY